MPHRLMEIKIINLQRAEFKDTPKIFGRLYLLTLNTPSSSSLPFTYLIQARPIVLTCVFAYLRCSCFSTAPAVLRISY